VFRPLSGAETNISVVGGRKQGPGEEPIQYSEDHETRSIIMPIQQKTSTAAIRAHGISMFRGPVLSAKKFGTTTEDRGRVKDREYIEC
jgi:hypothetical protein